MRSAPRRRLALAAVTMCAAGAALAGTAGTAGARLPVVGDADSVTIALNTDRVGYVGATLSGPAQAVVTLAEADQAGHGTLSRVTLPADGKLAVAKLLLDSCTLRDRAIQASTTVAGATETVTGSVTTPACTDRLDASVPASARMGSTATITLGDRWRVGSLPVQVCVQPPGGVTSCQSDGIAAGQDQRTVALPLPRIGGWMVTTSVPGAAPRPQIVWVSHPGPIRMLALGDSEMQILDTDLAQDLAPYHVQVVSDAQPSTGLTNPVLLNWQDRARQLVAAQKPDLSVVSMGANDGFSIGQNPCCDAAWSVGYGQLVAEMARTLLQGQAAAAYWFVLATPQPADFQNVFDGVNRGIVDASHTLAGRLGLIDANAYFTPGNRYRNYMVVNGHGFTIHESDGIHLDATADGYAAELVVKQLLANRVIR